MGLAALCFVTACSKTNEHSGTPMTSASDAKKVFGLIDRLWTGKLKPLLVKKPRTYADMVIVDSTTNQKIVVNGTYSVNNHDYSSGSVYASTTDLKVTFQHYQATELTLSGTIRFYEGDETRTDYGVSSRHSSRSYSTTDTTAAAAVAVLFNNDGKAIDDAILFSGTKSLAHFGVTMTGKGGQKYQFSY